MNITADDIARNIMLLGNKLNMLGIQLSHFTTAVRKAMENHDPTMVEDIDKELFKQQVIGIMKGTEMLKSQPAVDLAAIKKNKDVLEEMKRDAKEAGWLSTFHKAQRAFNHYINEGGEETDIQGNDKTTSRV